MGLFHRFLCSTAAALTFAGATAASAEPAAPLTLMGAGQLPTGAMFQGTEIGGLSGLDYDPAHDRYVAISDNRGVHGPVRFYDLTIDLSAGRLHDGAIQVHRVTTIQAADGASFAPGVVDPESIRTAGFPGLLYWTSEGNARTGLAPFVRVMTKHGAPVAAFDIPAVFSPGTGHGIRNNRAFESLTRIPGTSRWVTAVENALVQDGPAASLDTGSPVRVLTLDGTTGESGAQYVYHTEPVAAAPVPASGSATNGLSELLAIGPGRYIALERAYSAGVSNDIRLFVTDSANATDVRGLDTLKNAKYRAMHKHLLLDLATLPVDLDNIEALTRGPGVNGHATLILLSDNNFNADQRTQFIALRVDDRSLIAPQ